MHQPIVLTIAVAIDSSFSPSHAPSSSSFPCRGRGFWVLFVVVAMSASFSYPVFNSFVGNMLQWPPRMIIRKLKSKMKISPKVNRAYKCALNKRALKTSQVRKQLIIKPKMNRARAHLISVRAWLDSFSALIHTYSY